MRHTRIFVQFVVFWAALQSPKHNRLAQQLKGGSSHEQVRLRLWPPLCGPQRRLSLRLKRSQWRIAMATMTLILIHAMNTDS
jgi:hypothetical protein